ncbi:MAG: LON peptidase substrate-binding domain-containing protein [Actinobacteria bacterium]|nr:LON peptidase substrate-binding domain-containing protein [Actinomycetota bacterium]
MFPLETVLYPHVAIALHLFEPRYRALGRDLSAGNGRFGIVLISRGSEVGGGDQRHEIGTKARVTEALELPDGQWQMIAHGEERIRVDTWLPDDPYPVALVQPLPDLEPEAEPASELVPRAERAVKRALTLKAELDEPAHSASLVIASDPVRASYELAAVAPVPVHDHQRLLEAESAYARLALVEELAAQAGDTLMARLARGG